MHAQCSPTADLLAGAAVRGAPACTGRSLHPLDCQVEPGEYVCLPAANAGAVYAPALLVPSASRIYHAAATSLINTLPRGGQGQRLPGLAQRRPAQPGRGAACKPSAQTLHCACNVACTGEGFRSCFGMALEDPKSDKASTLAQQSVCLGFAVPMPRMSLGMHWLEESVTTRRCTHMMRYRPRHSCQDGPDQLHAPLLCRMLVESTMPQSWADPVGLTTAQLPQRRCVMREASLHAWIQ